MIAATAPVAATGRMDVLDVITFTYRKRFPLLRY